MNPTSLDQAGRLFIQSKEGCKLQAYQDVKGIWTIGYGNTMYPNGMSVRRGDIITQEEANELFKSIVSRFESSVNKLIRTDVNQSQYNALVSICYNIGIGAFGGSQLLRLVNRKAPKEVIVAEFLKWNKSGGKIYKGLTTRRQQEADMFCK